MKPVIVGISDLQLAQKPGKLVTYGLGSCVAVVLYAQESGVGSMAHVMLPLAYDRDDTDTPGKFADTAVASMVQMLEQKGITPPQIVAKMTGGADMFAGQVKGKGRRIGARNILSARKVLDNFGIRLVAQDVGGTVGRTAEFATTTGVLTVRTLRGGMKEL
jgi:chemotaxis protein CheD